MYDNCGYQIIIVVPAQDWVVYSIDYTALSGGTLLLSK